MYIIFLTVYLNCARVSKAHHMESEEDRCKQSYLIPRKLVQSIRIQHRFYNDMSFNLDVNVRTSFVENMYLPL